MELSLVKKIKYLSIQNKNDVFGSIANVLLDKKNDLRNFNINQYAKKANCSTASFLKFSKNLGFKGTKDLIPALLYEQSIMFNNTEEKIKSSNYLEDKINSYTEFVIEQINFTKKENENNILVLTNKLKKFEGKIYLIGKGANLDVINIFANYLSKNNFSVIHSYDFEVQQKWVDNFTAKDIIIVFSYSGKSSRIKGIVEKAFIQKSFIVNFSANLIEYIHDHSSINFKVLSNEEVLTNQRTARISFLFLVMLINIAIKK